MTIELVQPAQPAHCPEAHLLLVPAHAQIKCSALRAPLKLSRVLFKPFLIFSLPTVSAVGDIKIITHKIIAFH
jgi:hypothetical protein